MTGATTVSAIGVSDVVTCLTKTEMNDQLCQTYIFIHNMYILCTSTYKTLAYTFSIFVSTTVAFFIGLGGWT